MTTLTTLTTLVSLVLTGAIAGFFYAFSVTVMPGLDLATPAAAIEAMQMINVAVRNPVFFVTFFLTPVACAAAALALWLSGARVAAALLLAAAAIYLFGAFLPTVQVNVPMNRALEALAVPADAAQGRAVWDAYSGRWTSWNTARTVASLGSLACVGLGMMLWGARAFGQAARR